MSCESLTEAEVSQWIVDITGAPVAALDQIVGGFSRRTYSVQSGGRQFVARVDMADAPFAGTVMSLRREAQVYRALARTALPVPALLGIHPSGTALLFERAPGIPQLTELDATSHQAVLNDYLDRLAELHQLDPESIGIPAKVRTQEVHDELDRWESILDARTTRPWPVARLAFRLLRQHVPTGDVGAVLCHGDAGPKNFLHDGQKVTALLDWEFWHLGDPADDLAWWVFRAHQRGYGGGDLADQLARWQQRTGRCLTAAEMGYYTITVLARTLVTVAAGLDQQVTGIDQTVFLSLVPMLSVQILRGLAKLKSMPDLALAEPVADAAAELGNEAARLFRHNYIKLPPADSATQRFALTFERYLDHLAAVARYGRDMVEQEAHDASEILGLDRVGPADIEEYLTAAVAEGAVAEDTMAEDTMAEDTVAERVIVFLLRREYRRAWLWPATLAQTTAAPIDYAEVLASRTACSR